MTDMPTTFFPQQRLIDGGEVAELQRKVASAQSGIAPDKAGDRTGATQLKTFINEITNNPVSGGSVMLPPATSGRSVVVVNDSINTATIWAAPENFVTNHSDTITVDGSIDENVDFVSISAGQVMRFYAVVDGRWRQDIAGGGGTMADPLILGGIQANPPPPFGALMARQVDIAIQPQINGGAAAQAPLLLNSYLDNAGLFRYIGNGPAGALVTHDADAFGNPMSRTTIAVAPLNSAGGSAPCGFVGLVNSVWTPDGGYVVVGSVTSIPPAPVIPSNSTLITHQLVSQPDDYTTAFGAEKQSHIGLNVLWGPTGWLYVNNGPGALIQSRDLGPSGSESRINVAVMDVNTAGPGAPISALVGVLNIMYGPPGSSDSVGGGSPYVIVGDQSMIFATGTQTRFSLVVGGGISVGRPPPVPGPAGSIIASGNITGANFPSERRFKDQIADYSRGLDAICALQPKSWKWNGLGGLRDPWNRTQYGVLADEAVTPLPEAIGSHVMRFNTYEEERVDTLDDKPVLYALVNAVKELARKVEALGG